MNRWTIEEIELLKKLYSTATRKELESKLSKHSWASIRKTAVDLGVYRGPKHNVWSNEEIIKLRVLYPTATKEVLTKEILTHSYESIKNKAMELNILKMVFCMRTLQAKRPNNPCPYCKSIHVISHGIMYQCGTCKKSWSKSYRNSSKLNKFNLHDYDSIPVFDNKVRVIE